MKRTLAVDEAPQSAAKKAVGFFTSCFVLYEIRRASSMFRLRNADMVNTIDLQIKRGHMLAISKTFRCLIMTNDQFSQARG